MVTNFACGKDGLNRNQIEHSIRRNFGGFDPDEFDPMAEFRKKCKSLEVLPPQDDGRPPVDSIGLIRSSLSGEETAVPGYKLKHPNLCYNRSIYTMSDI